MTETQYNFCPVCGNRYPESSVHGFAHQCEKCSFVLYENLNTTASAVIYQNDKLLLVKRAKDPSFGKWDFAGGFVEPNEHPEEAVKREILEEIGVEAEIQELFGMYGPTEYFFQGKRRYNGDLYYLATVKSLDLKADDDVADFKWFSLDELPSNDEIAFPAQLQLIADIKKRFAK